MLNVDDSKIINVHRAGPPRHRNRGQPPKPRPLITLESPELASKAYGYGRGTKVYSNENPDDVWWVNPDLIQSDRIANYRARVAARERRRGFHVRDEIPHTPIENLSRSSREFREMFPSQSPSPSRGRQHQRTGLDGRQHRPQDRAGSFLS